MSTAVENRLSAGSPVLWPSAWRPAPLWSMFERIKDVDHPDEELLSVYREHGVVTREGREDNFNKAALDRSIYQLVHPGWLVVNRMKAWQGAVGISPFRGIVSGHYICFRPNHGEESRFLNWLLRSSVYAAEYSALSRGVRPGQVEIDNDWLRSLKVMCPPYEQQCRISDFLDAEVGKLDSIVRLRTQQYELLNDRIDSQVLEIIGRSELGASGEGEPLTAMRWLLRKIVRPAADTSEVITAFRDGQVTARSLRRTEGYANSASKDPQGQHVLVGELVVHGLDGFAGAIGDSEAEGNCSSVNHVMVPEGQGNPLYYGRLLRILALQGYLTGFAYSTRERAFDFRNWGVFGRIPLPVARIDEQHRIGDQIGMVRPLRNKLDHFSELIAERRQALITAAVTGQFDVSTASGRNVTEGISV